MPEFEEIGWCGIRRILQVLVESAWCYRYRSASNFSYISAVPSLAQIPSYGTSDSSDAGERCIFGAIIELL